MKFQALKIRGFLLLIVFIPTFIFSQINILKGTFDNGYYNSPYTDTLIATTNDPPIVWSLISGQLPQGLTFANTGILSGIPNLAGRYWFTVMAQDGAFNNVVLSIEMCIAYQNSFSLSIGDLNAAPGQTLTVGGVTATYTEWGAGTSIPAFGRMGLLESGSCGEPKTKVWFGPLDGCLNDENQNSGIPSWINFCGFRIHFSVPVHIGNLRAWDMDGYNSMFSSVAFNGLTQINPVLNGGSGITITTAGMTNYPPLPAGSSLTTVPVAYANTSGVNNSTCDLNYSVLANYGTNYLTDIYFWTGEFGAVPSFSCPFAESPALLLDDICSVEALITEICNNGIDDDGDGLIDCEDLTDCKPNAGSDQTVACFSTGSAIMSATGTGTWTIGAGSAGTATVAMPNNPNTTVTAFSATGTYYMIWSNGTCSDTALILTTDNCCELFCNGSLNNWILGSQSLLVAGVGDFSVNNPSLTSSTVTIIGGEVSTSISDSVGNILFYAYGDGILDKNGNIMPNGTFANETGTDGLLITRSFSNPNQYYVFHSSHNIIDLSYKVVDMTLNGGLGSCTSVTPITIYSNTQTGGMTLIQKSSCEKWLYFIDEYYNVFRLIVDTSGISIPVQVYTSGITTPTPDAFHTELIHNPCGNKIAFTTNYSNLVSQVIFLDVNPINGNLTPSILPSSLNIPIATPANSGYFSFDYEYSPDGSKLYVAMWGGAPTTIGGVLQYDMSLGSTAAIQASQTLVYDSIPPMRIELAKNGKIYFSNFNASTKIYSIENPNNNAGSLIFSHINVPASVGTIGGRQFYVNSDPACSKCLVTCNLSAGIDKSSCQSDSVQMAATGFGTWSIGAGSAGTATIINTTDSVTYVKNFSASGIYYMIWGNGICSDTALITVYPNPIINAINISCIGTSGTADVTVSASVSSGSLEYSLDGGSYQSANVFNSVPNGMHIVNVRLVGSICITKQNIDVNCPVCDLLNGKIYIK